MKGNGNWIEPKINWNKNDKFNIQDYNRIRGNLLFLSEKANELYPEFFVSEMGSEKTSYADFFYADEFNAFEENIDIINENIFTENYGIKKRFFDNGEFIKFDELNRIESAILNMKGILDRQKVGKNRIAFRLGDFKGVKI